MAHANLSHRRTHNLLLISKLLSQREGASPFTLIQDTLEQTAKPLLREYIRRAKLSKCHSVFLSFETVTKPADVDTFVTCYNKTPSQVAQAVSTAVIAAGRRCLVIIDSLTTLVTLSTNSKAGLNLTEFLSSLLQPPRQSPQLSVSLVAVYHNDIPVHSHITPYSPSPISLLSYLATTIITAHSLPILLAEKQARERSVGAQVFGLAEEKEGVLIGLKKQVKSIKPDERGIVLELEHRRKSGRGVLEWYFLPASASKQILSPQAFKEVVTLLDDHPLFRKSKDEQQSSSDQELSGVTFELGLTDRQRQEREGVVLPYFDAQKAGGGGPGEGGRILYDMGVEDDFDEEEDEI